MPRSKLPTTQVGIRFADDVLEQVDSFVRDAAAQMMQDWPGIEMNRANGIRNLVEDALRNKGYLPDEKKTRQIVDALGDGLAPKQIAKTFDCGPEDISYVQARLSHIGGDPAVPTKTSKKKPRAKK